MADRRTGFDRRLPGNRCGRFTDGGDGSPRPGRRPLLGAAMRPVDRIRARRGASSGGEVTHLGFVVAHLTHDRLLMAQQRCGRSWRDGWLGRADRVAPGVPDPWPLWGDRA